MRTILKDRVLVLVPETEAEARELADWKAAHADHVFRVHALDAAGLDLHDLGARADACREPINIVSTSRNAVVRRDSKAIPGVVMADIWMRIRTALRKADLGS
ncbi:MAG: hypothetical protein F9K29_09270 [Hyphomicrobiaceae bacterium]|nr:MAG: hypothetical protein F9K29_09270 [Hyphomicrobiaceae bacterium]